MIRTATKYHSILSDKARVTLFEKVLPAVELSLHSLLRLAHLFQKKLNLLIVILSYFVISVLLRSTSKAAIYDQDNQATYSQMSARLKKASGGVAVMVRKHSLLNFMQGAFSFPTDPVASILYHRKDILLCPDVKERRLQAMDSYCTAFLISPTTVATAAHCVNQLPCEQQTFVFGVTQENLKQTRADSDLYSCKQIISAEKSDKKDIALIELDRPVKDRFYFKISGRKPVTGNKGLAVIGYPLGLGLTAALESEVISVSGLLMWMKADVYSGQSGAPVLDPRTLNVVGVVNFGEFDWKYNELKKCFDPHICLSAAGDCRGEKVTLFKESSDFIKIN